MLGKRAQKRQIYPAIPASIADSRAGFPPTDWSLLRQVADGQWEPLLREYLRPCSRETVLICRRKGLELTDSEDVFQELMLRVMQPGKLGAGVQGARIFGPMTGTSKAICPVVS